MGVAERREGVVGRQSVVLDTPNHGALVFDGLHLPLDPVDVPLSGLERSDREVGKVRGEELVRDQQCTTRYCCSLIFHFQAFRVSSSPM